MSSCVQINMVLIRKVARVFSLSLMSLFLFANAGMATAQDKDKDKRETQRVQSMSQGVYKKLTEAQELIEGKEYQKGLSVLRELEGQKGLSNYEKAQLYNYFAYTYFTIEDYKNAIRSYEKVLIQPELPPALLQNTLYTLAQLHFISENYKKAVELINRWFDVTENPSENAYLLLGQGYYQLEQYENALKPLKTAYKMVKDKGEQPKENLLLLLRVVYFSLNDYPNMVKVLREMVDLYPKTEYWLTMAGAYSELKQYDKQMSILEALYEAGELERGNQQLNLANLYLMHDAPYKAAKILDKGVKQGKIEKNIRNLRLLSQAWFNAKEMEESIPPLKEAAKMSDDGDLNMRLAQAYLNLDKYSEAITELRAALKKGGLKRPDQANIMLGMALFEQENFNGAKRAFSDAADDKRSKKTAEQWLSYVSNEQNRKQQLEESLRR